jgi:DNA repair protein RadA/Sms
MAKAETSFVCQECGASSSKWSGKCFECGAWNSIVEFKVSAKEKRSSGGRLGPAALAASGEKAAPLHRWSEKKESTERLRTGFSEVDRVLGGGFLPGSLLLFGGEPGIGKSTLLLQVLGALSSATRCLYVSGEESGPQVAHRAARLGFSKSDELLFVSTADLSTVLTTIEETKPPVVVLDSVQTVSSAALESAAGTVSQVREVTQALLNVAKSSGAIVLLVGHVTKEGTVAGPRLLEHMVDGVFYFELSSSGGYRLLRGQKNRFGPTHEVAVFEMGSKGMMQVDNPSARFLAERADGVPGSAVVAHLEGSRPFLTEFQSLTQRCYHGFPRRTVQGIDQNRVSVLMAVLERSLKVSFAELDVYCKVASGARLEEPAADLPVLASLLSAALGKALPQDLILTGEVGLGGEVRSVAGLGARLSEAKSVGIRRAIIPEANRREADEIRGIDVFPIRDVRGLAKHLGFAKVAGESLEA